MSKGNSKLNGALAEPAGRLDGAESTNQLFEGRDAGHDPATDGAVGIPAIDPIEITQPRKRGRPPGSRDRNTRARNASASAEPFASAPAKTAARDIAERIEAALLSVHAIAARLLEAEELAIDETEAKDITAALLDASKYSAVSFDPKKLAYANLAIVLVGVYGARAVEISRRKRTENARPVTTTPARPASSPSSPAPAAPAAPRDMPAHVAAGTMAPSEFFRANGALDTTPIESFD